MWGLIVAFFVFCLRKLTVWASEKLWRWPYADWAYPLWSPTFTSGQINTILLEVGV